MAKGDFGEHLKREREMRGVSLEEISNATRIATRFLVAIENEQWDRLPGGVFNRGFVRAVARYLGLDEESILAEYSLAAGDRQSVPIWTGTPPAVAPDRPWLVWALAVFAVLVVIGGGWFVYRGVAAWRASRRAAAAAKMSAFHGLAAPYHSNAPQGSAPANSPKVTDSPAKSSPLKLAVEAGKTTHVIVNADGKRVYSGILLAGKRRTFTARDRFTVSARNAGALLLKLNGQTMPPIGPPGHSGEITLTGDSLKDPGGGAH